MSPWLGQEILFTKFNINSLKYFCLYSQCHRNMAFLYLKKKLKNNVVQSSAKENF